MKNKNLKDSQVKATFLLLNDYHYKKYKIRFYPFVKTESKLQFVLNWMIMYLQRFDKTEIFEMVPDNSKVLNWKMKSLSVDSQYYVIAVLDKLCINSNKNTGATVWLPPFLPHYVTTFLDFPELQSSSIFVSVPPQHTHHSPIIHSLHGSTPPPYVISSLHRELRVG